METFIAFVMTVLLCITVNMTNTQGVRLSLRVSYPNNSAIQITDTNSQLQCITAADVGPDEIDHINDVTAELASLDKVNVTWSIPSANNNPIVNYTLMFCARLETGCVNGTFTNVSLLVEGESALIRLDGNRLRYTFPDLLIGKEYEVVIRAANTIEQQMSPVFGNGLKFNSSFPDDGQVINVGVIPTTSTIILTWNLPPLALATNNLIVSFNVTYFSVSASQNIMSVAVEYNALRLEQGISVNLMMADSADHTFRIVALYTNPNLLSSQAYLTGVRTLANGATLLTGPEAVVSNSVSPDDVLTISWPAPINTNFLVAYRVSYTTSSARRRRQTPSTSELPVGTTSTTLPFTAFTNFAVNVDAIYTPPSGINATINLLPTTTFRTPERPSSPPRNVMAANESVVKIRLTWQPPTTPNGIITGYRIIGVRTGQTTDFGATVIGVNTLTYLSPALEAKISYTFRVAAVNGFGDGLFSPDRVVQTNFSVVQPVISSTAVGDSGSPLFTITTGRFSDEFGRVGILKVVVVRGSHVEPRNVPDSSLAPAGQSPFNYYVAHAEVATQLTGRLSGTTITIGNNVMTTVGGTTYTNPPPEVGEDYYVFIRLYSDLDDTVFVDSVLTGVLRINPPLNPAVIIAPIAVIAVVLLVILIVLLVVVFVKLRCSTAGASDSPPPHHHVLE